MKKKLILLGLASFALVAAVFVSQNQATPSSQPQEVSKVESLDELIKQFNPTQPVDAYAQDTIM